MSELYNTIITFNERGEMVVTGAHLRFMNFTGMDNTKFPNHLIKTFSFDIPEMYVQELIDRGYEVKTLTSRKDPESVFYILDAKIQFKARKDDRYNPKVYCVCNGESTLFDVDATDTLQNASILNVNFIGSAPWGSANTMFINRIDVTIEGNPYERNFRTEGPTF